MSLFRRSAVRAALLCCCCALAPGRARADELRGPISVMLTELQQLQYLMATGDKTAYVKQNAELSAMGEAIRSAKPDVWKMKSEVNAAAAYLLSGGQPDAILKLIDSRELPKDTAPLLEGALAYVAGRGREAEQLLAGFDPLAMDLRLAPQLAFAQSVLFTTRDPPHAARLLDVARLLAPGTLVEEAALRREILLEGDRHDGDKMIFLARQYVSRFPKSLYAQDFIRGLAAASVRRRLIDDIEDLRKFEALLSLVDPERRHAFLLTIAREQLLNGEVAVAGSAAHDVIGELRPGSPDAARARLYQDAARFLGDDYENSLADLKRIDAAKLSRPDQALLTAALHVATHLRDEPSAAEFAQADRENRVARARSPDPVPPDAASDPGGALIQTAETELRRADELTHGGENPP